MSENTITSYLSDIRLFLLFLDDRYSGKLPSVVEVTSEDISHALSSLQSKGVSKRTQSRFLSALRSFYKFVDLETPLESNPCDKISSPKIGKYLPDVLTVDEIEAIIGSVDLTHPQGIRNRAILEVLYSCGLRVSELVGLRLSDVFMEDSFVRVTGKGDKQRLVPLGEVAKEAITHYLSQNSRICAKGEDYLFLNRRGGKLSRVMVFNVVKEFAQQGGVNKSISPHTFRHSFASHLVENGAPLRAVQQMLGHESILTTEIYTHIDREKWEREILEHHPRG